ncbi:L-threonylcarbamoyladenylate synthase [Leptospira levettii]|uniref:Threonylcarbamoyl-AMP synthase n=1 Tax=Leptospira levettii TaxID=2023178 RepID=A0ABY2MKH7_9LEPT|nr:L-threonylcarbamoyladenylate synthase [Leptospira levettii]TGL67615.1 threonylcarbamoyl-AMP synthase [Leptospira levettii]TGM28090.1 threonylcarbamoyl-AMP synthase [Leptospira levettii]TGM82850.1 threonylcarbamoyl-AMP synthase [Leptospira levettii]
MKTLISSDVRLLADLIRKGGVVVFPTETVFGIGASSFNEEACKRIYKIKGRPSDNPLIAHFSSIESIKSVCEVSEIAERLLLTFSPGPITLVLPKKNPIVFPKELPTLGVRIPKNPIIREWIEECGSPISAPSANLSGRPSLTRMSDALRYFDGVVDGILVAEEPKLGIESTVVGLYEDPPVLLRPGSIESNDLKRFLPNLVMPNSVTERGEFVPPSPGMKYKHYSPKANVKLLPSEKFLSEFRKCMYDSKTAWIGFSYVLNPSPGDESLEFDPTRMKFVSSNWEYSSALYAFFEFCDQIGIHTIYCEEPKEGEGKEGLLNRLQKASEDN